MTEIWWLSSDGSTAPRSSKIKGPMTVTVAVEDGIIVSGPPIIRRNERGSFIDRPLRTLEAYMRRRGGFRMEKLGHATVDPAPALSDRSTQGRR